MHLFLGDPKKAGKAVIPAAELRTLGEGFSSEGPEIAVGAGRSWFTRGA